jgi:alkanesulfonate monooxygenase SsuD/methylene tetrahydromethanopterin reductase-like flavin-dependent oxidoreductase (luciferase family)
VNITVMLAEGSMPPVRPLTADGEPADTLAVFADLAQSAERAKADAIFVPDIFRPDPPRMADGAAYLIEPASFLGALAARTSAIGLIGTASTTFSDVYHVAREFSSLDQLSNGRAAWNIATSSMGQELFGRSMPSHSDRYRMAREFVDSVGAYWTRWGPTSAQGAPVLVLAAASDEARDFGGDYVDLVASTWRTIESARAFRSGVRARAQQSGRDPDRIRAQVLVGPIMGATEQRAQEAQREILDAIDWERARVAFQRRLNGLDLSGLDLDEPIPAELLPESEQVEHFGLRSRYELYRHYAVDERRTLRQLLEIEAQFGGNWAPVGTPEQIANLLAEWYLEGACDGFVLHHTHRGDSWELFMEGVIPTLQRRGLFRREYAEPTLRGNLLHETGSPATASR